MISSKIVTILETYLVSRMTGLKNEKTGKMEIIATEMQIVEIIETLVQSYDHSIETVEDIIHYSKKLEELLQTGVEGIAV